jgi:DNA-binding CsgD family transcriptional regulator
LQHFICLCRTSPEHPFTETERALTEHIAPHLLEAYNHNAVLHLSTDKSCAHATALCDRHGLLHHADAQFRPFMHAEWPEWDAPTLPFALDDRVDDSPQLVYDGRAIVVIATALDARIQLRVRTKSRSDCLTPRERLITRHLVNGEAYKGIAELLKISPSTVTKHVNAIYRKLGVKNKTQLAQMIRQDDGRS